MSQQSNTKLYIYVLVLTVVFGGSLSLCYNSLKGIHATNKENARKADILSAIPDIGKVENPSAIFADRITVFGIKSDGTVFKKIEEVNKDRPIAYKKIEDIDLAIEDKMPLEKRIYPLYQYKGNKGEMYNIVAVRGNGLWDKIWGYIALEADYNTIAGIYFGHKGETPGLGAEIKDNAKFKAEFIKKQIYKGDKYVSVLVKKKIKDKEHEIATISGATVTSDGVSEMMDRGIKNYLAYFDKEKITK
jgi:Na+-transporting NADH:ubiquinone oxidoreductase subunit C